jgi:hypothetical protein
MTAATRDSATHTSGDPGDDDLNRWLPVYYVREYHDRLVPGSPEQAMAATLRLPVAPDRIVRMLFRLRRLGAGRQTIAEFASSGGFLILDQTPTTFVFGLAGRLQGRRLARSTAEWHGWSPPGVKIVADFRAARAADGQTRLSTETRVQSLDLTSRTLFRLYWLLIGPFSALIRRRWLRAISRACAAEAR